jgi:hypothetical protein
MRPLQVSANGVRWFEIEPVHPLTARGILVTGDRSGALALGVPAWSDRSRFRLPLPEGPDDGEARFTAVRATRGSRALDSVPGAPPEQRTRSTSQA